MEFRGYRFRSSHKGAYRFPGSVPIYRRDSPVFSDVRISWNSVPSLRLVRQFFVSIPATVPVPVMDIRIVRMRMCHRLVLVRVTVRLTGRHACAMHMLLSLIHI